MRTLTHENDKLKQNSHQTERLIAQFKRDKEELQQKVDENQTNSHSYSLFIRLPKLKNEMMNYSIKNLIHYEMI
jgi:hypothetical protein